MNPNFRNMLWICAGLVVMCWAGCGDEDPEATGIRSAQGEGVVPSESWNDHSPIGILNEILDEPQRIKEAAPLDYARVFVRRLYKDGDIATAIDSISWHHKLCRIGHYQCKDLSSKPRQVGALVSMVPNHELRPDGMTELRFQTDIAPTLRELVPAPDKALPYSPKPDIGERLMTFLDHHGLSRYLLLQSAGDTWRVVCIGSWSQLSGSEPSSLR